MTHEVMQQALDALRMPCDRWLAEQSEIVNEAVAALQSELAKPEPEPVAYGSFNKQGDLCSTVKHKDSWRTVPLYAAQGAKSNDS